VGPSLATLTREAYEQATVDLGEAEQALVSCARRSRNRRATDRDALLASIVESYRKGPRETWAAVLLDVLTPAILKRLERYRAEEPTISAEDIRQQFVMELLTVAATAPMPADAKFVERRLLLRAGQGIRRWLRKEGRYRAFCESLDELGDQEEESK
jgi:hypothetical protein